MRGDAGSGTSTRSRTGSGARAARPDRAASRPRSLSTAGCRPRMNSRSSVRASTASSWAAAGTGRDRQLRRRRRAGGVRPGRRADRRDRRLGRDRGGRAFHGTDVAGRRLRRPDQGRGGVPRRCQCNVRGGEMSTLRVTQARVMKSEWTKLRTQPGALWSLLSAVILVVAFGILYSLLRVARPPHGAATATFDPTSVSLAGVQLAQIAAGVLGVLLITSEYATGLIRTTLAAVPRRLPTLWGKAAVLVAAMLAVSVPAAVAVFLAGQA